MITGATCTAIELVDCGGPELVRTDVSCQLDRFGCTWLACSKMRRRGWGGREMLANETPVCVTIRDCCTAGFDVHLQASTIHPSLSLSLSYPPPSSRVLFLAEPFPSSSLLSYPIRSTGIEEGKGEGEKVWIGLCVRGDAKVQKRRSRKSTERGERSETCRRIGEERRVGE